MKRICSRGGPRYLFKLPARVLPAFLLFLVLAPVNLSAKPAQGRKDIEGPQQRYRHLLTSPVVTTGKNSSGKAVGIVRRRAAHVNLGLISKASAKEKPRLRLDLFDDVILDAVLTKCIKRSPSSYTWFGKILGHKQGTIALAAEDDVMVANISVSKKKHYQIRYLSNGLHEVRQIDANLYPACDGSESIDSFDMLSEPAQLMSQAEHDPPMAADGGSVADVMVVYTPAARVAEGGTSAIHALINLAVDEANQIYLNSQINMHLRLVHKDEVSYTESGSVDTDLDRLTDDGDGYMDSVHVLRDTYGADMVCLLAELTDVGGKAWCMVPLMDFEPWAFSVVRTSQTTGPLYTFAHELGHNMGCNHDRDNAVGGLYDYSYGWRFTGDSMTQWRTIMAYLPGTRIPYFSNPDLFYDGQPTGQINSEDNARSINNAASTIVSWRDAVVPSPPVVQDVNVSAAKAVDKTILLSESAYDEGLPDPPGLLNYIITSLPLNGVLDDPAAGLIDAVPYTLVNDGNEVIYTSEDSYTGLDTFTFKVNDGGSDPNGGDSNIATVSIDVTNSPDLDNSGRVDMDDFAILAYQWQQEPDIPSADISPIGGDGIVDIDDLAVLVDDWLL